MENLSEEKFEVVHQPKSLKRKKRYIEETDAIWDKAHQEAERLRGKQLQHFLIFVGSPLHHFTCCFIFAYNIFFQQIYLCFFMAKNFFINRCFMVNR